MNSLARTDITEPAAPLDPHAEAPERAIRFLRFFTGALALAGLTMLFVSFL